MSNEHEVRDIVLRDIQPLLRGSLGEGLIVQSFTTKSLLPPGENYGSTILEVRAVIKRDHASEEEDLHLIAKMAPPTEYQRRIFDSPYTFRKEIFMYEHIMPSYNKLEIEAGIKEDEVINVVAKFYGSRLSLDPNIDFDDNAVILLENLKIRGYYTGDRVKGYNIEHARLAIRVMARFHAIGIAMKIKKPEHFEVLKKRAKCVKLHTDEFKSYSDTFTKKLEEDEALLPYRERCAKALNESMEEAWIGVPKEPWSTIVHSDFWVNNIMFHSGEDGHVDDVKFVDFQNYLFLSPLREMIFFIFSSVNFENDQAKANALIDLYHETFIAVLTKMGCDVEPFSREKFDAKIIEDAYLEFPHICFMLKVLTLNANEVELDHSKLKTVMLEYAGNQIFMERLREFVLDFAKRNWI